MVKPFLNSAGWLVCLLILITARPAMAQSTSLVRTNTSDSQTVGATATNGSNIPLGNPRTITWSLVPDGTKIPIFYYAGSDPNRPSRLIVGLDNDFSVPAGSRGADLTARPWFSSFQNMVNRTANKTGLTFIYEPNDDGREIGASNSDGVIGLRGDLRIGGGPLSGALGYNGIPSSSSSTASRTRRCQMPARPISHRPPHLRPPTWNSATAALTPRATRRAWSSQANMAASPISGPLPRTGSPGWRVM